MTKDYSIAALLDYYGNMLTDKQNLCVDYYYNEDLTLSEISEHLNITRQGVRDNIKRAEAILFEAEDKLRLYEKDKAFLVEKQRILSDLDDILSKSNIIANSVTEKIVAIRNAVNLL